jgi:lauroyl/myristoyl acyltransferase
MWKYWAFCIAAFIFPRLPASMGYFIASLTGNILYFTAPRSRRAVAVNAWHVMRPTDRKTFRRTVRRIFVNASKNYYDLLRVPGIDLPRLRSIVALHGWEHFEGALAQGRGVVVATAHLGNFDLVAQIMVGLSVPVAGLAEPLRPRPLFRVVSGLRTSRGLSFFPVGYGGLKALIRVLRLGGAVGVACDRDIQKNGVPVEFMGELTALPPGPVDLALHTGALVVPAFSVRRTNNAFDLYMEPALSFTDRSRRLEYVRELAGYVEKYVRAHVDQWVVMEPVWHTETRRNHEAPLPAVALERGRP